MMTKAQIQKQATRLARMETAKNILLDFGVYFFVLAGIILSRYMPQFRSGDRLVWIPMSWVRMAISAMIALMIVGSVDFDADRDKSKGKRKGRRVLARITLAIGQGFLWQSIIG